MFLAADEQLLFRKRGIALLGIIMRKISFWLFIAGFLLAVILEAIWYMSGYHTPSGYVDEKISLILWPSAIFKMALMETMIRGFKYCWFIHFPSPQTARYMELSDC